MFGLKEASTVFGLFERLLRLITGRRAITRKHFDEVVVPLFTELDVVVRQYHDILWQLNRDIFMARSHAHLEKAVKKAHEARQTFVTSRARIFGLFNGIAGYRGEPGETPSPTIMKSKRKYLLWLLAYSINQIFRSPLEQEYTMMWYVFEEVFRSRSIRSFTKRQEYLTSILRGGMFSVSEAWKAACYSYAQALALYKKL